MKHNLWTYIIILSITLLSFGSAAFLPVDETIRAMIASPGVLSLLSALFQLIRDQAAYEKQLDIQARQFRFTLGAASHMANVAFDKHAEFCELYMKEINAAVHTLYQEGETKEVIPHALNLQELRRTYALWITDEINSDLFEFEKALRELGVHSKLIHETTGEQGMEERRLLRIEECYDLFSRILGLETKEIDEKVAAVAVTRKVRSILGVEELFSLRSQILQDANNALNA